MSVLWASLPLLAAVSPEFNETASPSRPLLLRTLLQSGFLTISCSTRRPAIITAAHTKQFLLGRPGSRTGKYYLLPFLAPIHCGPPRGARGDGIRCSQMSLVLATFLYWGHAMMIASLFTGAKWGSEVGIIDQKSRTMSKHSTNSLVFVIIESSLDEKSWYNYHLSLFELLGQELL